jgi:hypothetical protein
LSGSGLSIAGQDHCDLYAFLPGTRDYQFASHLLGPRGHRRQSETVLSITQRNEVTLSSSRNAVNFSSACTTKRFPSLQCASAIQIVRPRESRAETQQFEPALLRLSAMISHLRFTLHNSASFVFRTATTK